MGTNDVTGARLVSKPTTPEYEEGHDRIFGKKRTPQSVEYYPPGHLETRQAELWPDCPSCCGD